MYNEINVNLKNPIVLLRIQDILRNIDQNWLAATVWLVYINLLVLVNMQKSNA